MAAKDRLGSQFPKAHGIGTPIAGYSEEGPFHCEDCIYMSRPQNGRGLCKEKHVLADMKKGKVKKDEKSGLASINLEHGCCEYVKPPKGKE